MTTKHLVTIIVIAILSSIVSPALSQEEVIMGNRQQLKRFRGEPIRFGKRVPREPIRFGKRMSELKPYLDY